MRVRETVSVKETVRVKETVSVKETMRVRNCDIKWSSLSKENSEGKSNSLK